MFPRTPTTPFPTNFLATPVHSSTLKHNKDGTWATRPCSEGRWSLLPGGLCTANSHLIVTVVFPAQVLSMYHAHVLSRTRSQAAGTALFFSSSAVSPMSSFPFTCTAEGKQREVSGGLSTPPSIPQAGSPLTTGEDLGYVTTLCMSQQASAPKHSFGLHLSILTKYLKA